MISQVIFLSISPRKTLPTTSVKVVREPSHSSQCQERPPSMQQPGYVTRTSFMHTSHALSSELDDMISYLYYHQNVQPEYQTTTSSPFTSQIFSACGEPLSATFNDNHLSQMGLEPLGTRDDQPWISLSPTQTQLPFNDTDLVRLLTRSTHTTVCLSAVSMSSSVIAENHHCRRLFRYCW